MDAFFEVGDRVVEVRIFKGGIEIWDDVGMFVLVSMMVPDAWVFFMEVVVIGVPRPHFRLLSDEEEHNGRQPPLVGAHGRVGCLMPFESNVSPILLNGVGTSLSVTIEIMLLVLIIRHSFCVFKFLRSNMKEHF